MPHRKRAKSKPLIDSRLLWLVVPSNTAQDDPPE
jgi:hypothetical protein